MVTIHRCSVEMFSWKIKEELAEEENGHYTQVQWLDVLIVDQRRTSRRREWSVYIGVAIGYSHGRSNKNQQKKRMVSIHRCSDLIFSWWIKEELVKEENGHYTQVQWLDVLIVDQRRTRRRREWSVYTGVAIGYSHGRSKKNQQKKKMVTIHRCSKLIISWQIKEGLVEEGMVSIHRCSNYIFSWQIKEKPVEEKNGHYTQMQRTDNLMVDQRRTSKIREWSLYLGVAMKCSHGISKKNL